MAFCSNCGSQIEESAKFCPSCGSAIPTQDSDQQTSQQSNQQTNQQTNRQNSQQSNNANSGDFFTDINNTADTTSQYDPADIEANKVLCIFAYFGIFFLIPLLAAPNSKFARFHAGQGFNLFLLSIITFGIGRIPVLGGVLGFLLFACELVLVIIGIVNAVKGKAKELPVIGKFKILN